MNFVNMLYEVIDIRVTENQGITDETLWQKAQREKCLPIITDKGFSSYREEPNYGILIIRLKQPTGYYTQREQMVAGQTELFAHDGQGRMVYFEIQEGKGNLKEMVHRLSNKWESCLNGVKPIIISVWDISQSITWNSRKKISVNAM